jgi:hypothetical protein
VSVKTDYSIGEYVKINKTGVPVGLRNYVGKITKIYNAGDFGLSVDLCGTQVGFCFSEVRPATDVEILRARLSNK